MKTLIRQIVRSCHLDFFQDVLPRDIAIYFHEMEAHQLPQFLDAIDWFTDNGYEIVDVRRFLKPSLAGKRLFISFDDNFRSWHQALAAFERAGVKCTFYVNSGVFSDVATPSEIDAFFDRICHRGQRETLTTSQLVELGAAGHTIGCHTHTHPVLSELGEEHWPSEIGHSKQRLEEIIGAPVDDFSFPFGMRRHFSRRLREYCKSVGFSTVATALSGLQHALPRDRYAVHRTGWQFSRSLEENLDHLRVDARFYAALTGRSALG